MVRGNESEAHAILVCVAGLGVLLTAGGLGLTAPGIQQPESGDDGDRDEQPLGVEVSELLAVAQFSSKKEEYGTG